LLSGEITSYNRAARYSLSNKLSKATQLDVVLGLSRFVSANKTPLILSIETATRAGSIAVSRGHALLAAQRGDASNSQSAHLLQIVGNVLEEAGVTLNEIDIFAAALGPGSFTGLRIGLATVKSFAATLKRQCVGVPTLYAVAHAAGESERTLALLPAGRGEVFAQLLKVEQSGDVYPIDSPIHITPHKLLEKVKAEKSLIWAGEGARLHAEAIEARALAEGILYRDESQHGQLEQSTEQQWTLAPSQEILAADVGQLAWLRYRSSEVVFPEHLRAIYVRPSDAELNQ
jgi:tRNA threonylcarbamoyladenosine biosynthesis protein TsaB